MFLLKDCYTTKQYPLYAKITSSKDNVFHQHDFFELFYIIEGSIEHQTTISTELLNPGEGYLMNLNSAHIFLRDCNNTSKHRDIVINKEFFKEICDYLNPSLYNKIINDVYSNKFMIPLYSLTKFEERFELLNTAYKNNHTMYLSNIKSILIDFLVMILNNDYLKSKKYPQWIENLLRTINDTANISLSPSDFTSSLFYSREYICRSFKKYTGQNLTSYINNVKLEYSLNEIIFTNLSLSEIAMNIGIATQAYFIKIFKQKYHCTPSEFRKKSKLNINKESTKTTTIQVKKKEDYTIK